MILESGSGKNQHYACPKGQTVDLPPHGENTVPMDGVCLNRNKPPVGKGVTGDLVVNEGNPRIPKDANSHVPAKDANKLLRICTFGWPEARIAGHYPELAVAAVDVMAALWLVNDRRRI